MSVNSASLQGGVHNIRQDVALFQQLAAALSLSTALAAGQNPRNATLKHKEIQMKMTKTWCLFPVVLMLILVAPLLASAAYSEKPVNMIIAFTAGGSSDVQARIMQKYWNKYAPEDEGIDPELQAAVESAFEAQ